MEIERKQKIISLSVAALITAIFAVPYFYYEYFYETAPVQTASQSESSILASVINPIKSAGKNFKALLSGDLLKDSVYIKE